MYAGGPRCVQGHGYHRKTNACLSVQNLWAEASLWAMRKGGELLAGVTLHNGDPQLHDATRLSDLSIEKTQSSRWQ